MAAFVVWLGLVSSRPLAHPEPYLRPFIPKAAPQCISGRTSYLRVRLAFHLYPQLIPGLCNVPRVRAFTPMTIGASPWPWVAHPVSGLIPTTAFALLRLAFASGSLRLHGVNLAAETNSPAHSSIGTPSSLLAERLRPYVGPRFQVYFTPLPGFFSPFPHGTGTLSVAKGI